MKRYRVTIETVHDYTEDELRQWMKSNTEHPMSAFNFSPDMERRVLKGERVQAAKDREGMSHVTAQVIQ